MGHSTSKVRSRSSKSVVPAPAFVGAQSGEPCIVVTSADEESTDVVSGGDYTLNLPDECLACIFQLLSAADRNRSSLVCRRWLQIDGENRHRLSLNAQSHVADVVPRLLSRFVGVTKLALKCDRRSISIGDETLTLISQNCRNLTRLKIRACRELTDDGVAVCAANCKKLQKFSCGSSNFGAKGINSLLHHCALEDLSLKRLRGISDAAVTETIQPGKAAESLKMICLKDLYNGQCFEPLISAAKNLKSLKLIRCSGDWDKLLQLFAISIKGLTEIHLERLQVSDSGLSAISHCSNLEVLHLVKTPKCSNIGLINLSEKCNSIRKLHIDGWRTNRISDDGLIAIATNCPNLQELILIGLNPTHLSLSKLATNCRNLERLAFCGSETIGDVEISCIAARCNALKKLCIKSCPVSNHGMEALAAGCPNLVKVKVKRCRGVTSEVADWLKSCRDSLLVNLDVIEPESQDVNVNNQGNGEVNAAATNASRNAWRSASLKMRLRSFSSRRWVACTWRRWSSYGARIFSSSGRSIIED